MPSAAGGTSWIVSFMGGNERTGRWRVAERCNVVNFMGGSELDLCDVELSDHVTEVNVFTMMGGGEVRRGRKKRDRDDRRELER